MDQATQFISNNRSLLSTLAFLVVIVVLVYVIYTYLYPAEDPSYTEFLNEEVDARKSFRTKGTVPGIFTGGDFTLSMWIYIDDWNYRATKDKFLFSLGPKIESASSTCTQIPSTLSNVLVGILTPYKNGLMVRANTGAAPAAGSPAPDYTKESALCTLLNPKGQGPSTSMWDSTVTDTPCDIKEVPLQKWVNITIVSSGRILDVYMDGKLSRSCVLDNVVQIPGGNLDLRLGAYGAFGGRYSSVQMWNVQLTPDVIYGIYQMGPSQTKHDILTDIAKWLGINVNFTGVSSGSSSSSQASCVSPDMIASLTDKLMKQGKQEYAQFSV